MKSRIVLIIFIILFSFTSANSDGLVDTKEIVDNIDMSINEHPESWIDTGSKFVYCKDPSEMKRLRKKTWPAMDATIVLVYNFHGTFFYADLDKPFEYKFKGEKLKQLIQSIKLYKFKKLKKEVGNLLQIKEEAAKKKLELKIEQNIKEDRPKKL